MGLPGNGKPAESCAACGHTPNLHSNEACEAIRCDCRVTRKQLAAGTRPVVSAPDAAIVVPVFTPAGISLDRASPLEAKAPEEPAKGRRMRRDRSDGTHAA
jgi:hypothetical protein